METEEAMWMDVAMDVAHMLRVDGLMLVMVHYCWCCGSIGAYSSAIVISPSSSSSYS